MYYLYQLVNHCYWNLFQVHWHAATNSCAAKHCHVLQLKIDIFYFDLCIFNLDRISDQRHCFCVALQHQTLSWAQEGRSFLALLELEENEWSRFTFVCTTLWMHAHVYGCLSCWPEHYLHEGCHKNSQIICLLFESCKPPLDTHTSSSKEKYSTKTQNFDLASTRPENCHWRSDIHTSMFFVLMSYCQHYCTRNLRRFMLPGSRRDFHLFLFCLCFRVVSCVPKSPPPQDIFLSFCVVWHSNCYLAKFLRDSWQFTVGKSRWGSIDRTLNWMLPFSWHQKT